jgi:hypothetical protein
MDKLFVAERTTSLVLHSHWLRSSNTFNYPVLHRNYIQGDMKVTLRCPKCFRTVESPLYCYEPPGTSIVECFCPECSYENDIVTYYDKDGNILKPRRLKVKATKEVLYVANETDEANGNWFNVKTGFWERIPKGGI